MSEQDFQMIIAREKMRDKQEDFSPDEADPGSESELVAKIRKWAKQKNYPCHIHPQSSQLAQFIEPGDPDIILFLPFGCVVLFEAKVKGGRLSKTQKHRAITYSHLGHIIHKIMSFKRFLEIVERMLRKE